MRTEKEKRMRGKEIFKDSFLSFLSREKERSLLFRERKERGKISILEKSLYLILKRKKERKRGKRKRKREREKELKRGNTERERERERTMFEVKSLNARLERAKKKKGKRKWGEKNIFELRQEQSQRIGGQQEGGSLASV